MVRYLVRNVSYADEQLSQLPRSLRTAFDARVEDLKDDPYAVGDPHEDTRSYSTTFGEGGWTVPDLVDSRAEAAAESRRRDRLGDTPMLHPGISGSSR